MKDSEKKFTISYTELKCKSCKNLVRRKFTQGDIVFEENGICDQCEGNLLVMKIFGETIG